MRRLRRASSGAASAGRDAGLAGDSTGHGAAVGVGLGVLAQPWRAVVRPDGAVEPPHGATLRWAVVAEDRVHDPATAPTRRQRCIDGTPVVETSVRVPGGDVVVTAFAVADDGGALVLDVENRSATSVAFAWSRADVVAARPSSAPPAGGELPASWRTLPLAHGSSLRLALPSGAFDGHVVDARVLDGRVLGTLPEAAQVVRGWQLQLAGGLRIDLPEPTMDERLRRSRAEACLGAPADPEAEPERFLLAAGQRASMRLLDGIRADDVAAAASLLVGSSRKGAPTPWAAAALVAASEVLAALGDERAATDARAMAARLGAAAPVPDDAPGDDGRFEAWLTRLLAVADGPAGARIVRLLPTFSDALRAAWLGANLSAYQVPTLAGHVGFALRWHGERPALLWEAPLGVVVTCPGLDPDWSSSEPQGETLLAAPR